MTQRTATLTTLLLLLTASAAQAGITLTLRENAAVKGAYIRIRDIATVQGSDESQETANAVARLFVGPAPVARASEIVTREQIARRLAERGWAEIVTVTGAPSVLVRRAGEVIPGAVSRTEPRALVAPASIDSQMMCQQIEQAIADQLRATGLPEDNTISVQVRSRERDLPGGIARARLETILSGTLPGHARVRVALLDAREQTVETRDLQTEAMISASVVMLRRALRANEVIGENDVIVMRRNWRAGEMYVAANLDEVVGRAAARSLQANQPLKVGDLVEPLAVRKGEVVKVDTLAGGFRVRSLARALKDARMGEIIEVQNLDTQRAVRKTYPVRVIGPGVVAVARF